MHETFFGPTCCWLRDDNDDDNNNDDDDDDDTSFGCFGQFALMFLS